LVNQGAILVTCTVHVDAFLVMGLLLVLAGLFAPTSLLRPPVIVVRKAEKLPISSIFGSLLTGHCSCDVTARNQKKVFHVGREEVQKLGPAIAAQPAQPCVLCVCFSYLSWLEDAVDLARFTLESLSLWSATCTWLCKEMCPSFFCFLYNDRFL
jgi:hypothetical protein